MSKSKVIVFPNGYVESKGASVWMTKVVREFVADIHKRDVKTSLAAITLAYCDNSRHDTLLDESDGIDFFDIYRLPSENRPKARKLVDYFSVTYQLLTKVPKEPLWYIFLPGHASFLACLICCLLRKPFGIYVRGECEKSGLQGRLYQLIYRQAKFILATGESITGSLKKFNSQVQAVAPMMTFNEGDLCEKPSYALKEHIRVLFVGSLNPAKGAFEFIKALPLVADQHNVTFVLAGSGSEQATRDLHEEIQLTGYAKKVELVGYVGEKQELAKLYSSADIFCFPSHSEGFARVMYEAMGFGLPIVNTDFETGDPPHFMQDRVNCLYIKKRDPKDVARKINELIADESLRRSLGKTAFTQAKQLHERFSGMTHGSQMSEALEQIND